jgi:hypothetical protein
MEDQEMSKKRKVEHFWISNTLADKFVAWCKKQKDLKEQEPISGEFSPEFARFLFTDPTYGFTLAFMLYENLKYNCVNVPANTRIVFSKFASDTGLEMPCGSLGLARGDGKNDADKAAARAAAAAVKKAAKEQTMLEKAKAEIKTKSAKPKVTKDKAKVKK